MRRARIQARPNIGGRARVPAPPTSSASVTQELKTEKIEVEMDNKAEMKKEDVVKSSVEVEHSQAMIPVVDSTPIAVEPSNLVEEKSDKTSSPVPVTAPSGPVRRSRLKPQVKLMAKPRGNISSVTTPRVCTSSTSSNNKDIEKSGGDSEKETLSAGSTLVKPLKEDESAMLLPSPLLSEKSSILTEDSSVKDENIKTVAANAVTQVSVVESKPATIPIPKRGRFVKPRPNLIETGRKRNRHASMSGQSDTDDEAVVKRAPPPIQRHASLASKTPERSSDAMKQPQNAKQLTENNTEKAPVISTASGNLPSPALRDCHSDTTESQSEAVGAEFTNIRQDVRDKSGKPRLDFRKKVKETTQQTRRDSRKQVLLQKPIDRAKMTISDLIYSNPVTNRMKSSVEEEERQKQRKARRKSDDEVTVGSPERSPDREGAPSVVSSTSRRPSVGSPDRQSVAASERRAPSIGSPDRQSMISDGPTNEDDPMKEESDELAPQITIGADGQIIVSEKSLYVANPDPDRTIEETEAVEEFGNAPYRPSMYYGRTAKAKTWGWRETKKFYLALSVIGSDFSMISTVFSNRSRVDIKKKFKREEKINRFLIEKALKEPKTYDLSIFDSLSSSEDEETKKERKREEKEAKKVARRETRRKDNELEKQIVNMRKQKKNTDKTLKQAVAKKKKRSNSKKIMYDSSSSDGDENTIENIPPQGCIKEPTIFCCALCGIGYTTKVLLKAHMQKHDMEKIVEQKQMQKQMQQQVIGLDHQLDSGDDPPSDAMTYEMVSISTEEPQHPQSSLIINIKNSRQILYDSDHQDRVNDSSSSAYESAVPVVNTPPATAGLNVATDVLSPLWQMSSSTTTMTTTSTSVAEQIQGIGSVDDTSTSYTTDNVQTTDDTVRTESASIINQNNRIRTISGSSGVQQPTSIGDRMRTISGSSIHQTPGTRIRTVSGSTISQNTPGSCSKIVPTSDGSQIVFVSRFKPGEKEGVPGKKVVHMYMVSPPPTMPPQAQSTGSYTTASVSSALQPANTSLTSTVQMQPISSSMLSTLPSGASTICYIDPVDGSTKIILEDKTQFEDISQHQPQLHDGQQSEEVYIVLDEDTEQSYTEASSGGCGQFVTTDLQSPPPRVISITPLLKNTTDEKMEVGTSLQSGMTTQTTTNQNLISQFQTQNSVTQTQSATSDSNLTWQAVHNSNTIINQLGTSSAAVISENSAIEMDFTESESEPHTTVITYQNSPVLMSYMDDTIENNSESNSRLMIEQQEDTILNAQPLTSISSDISYSGLSIAGRPPSGNQEGLCINVLPQYPSPSPIFTVPKLTTNPSRREGFISHNINPPSSSSSSSGVVIREFRGERFQEQTSESEVYLVADEDSLIEQSPVNRDSTVDPVTEIEEIIEYQQEEIIEYQKEEETTIPESEAVLTEEEWLQIETRTKDQSPSEAKTEGENSEITKSGDIRVYI